MLLRDLEQKIVKIINESGMSIDGVYFIMKSLMAEIEQRYNEFCIKEDAEAAQALEEFQSKNKETESADEESVSTK